MKKLSYPKESQMDWKALERAMQQDLSPALRAMFQSYWEEIEHMETGLDPVMAFFQYATEVEDCTNSKEEAALVPEILKILNACKKPAKRQPFTLRYVGADGRMTKRFYTLAKLCRYVNARWQGEDYMDGPTAFHTDYASYTITGAILIPTDGEAGEHVGLKDTRLK